MTDDDDKITLAAKEAAKEIVRLCGGDARIAFARAVVAGIQLTTRESQSKGGREGGKTRLAAAEEGWRGPALQLAIAIRAKKKDISQQDLATDIIFAWKLEKPPGHSTLVLLIRKWELAGKLPRRQK